MTKASDLRLQPPGFEETNTKVQQMRRQPDRKWFAPSFKCERDNVFVGPAGFYETREEAEQADEKYGLIGVLMGFEPNGIREVSYEDLHREDTIPTSMAGAAAYVIEGPLTQQYGKRRNVG